MLSKQKMENDVEYPLKNQITLTQHVCFWRVAQGSPFH